ncbi:MAG: type III PLP-dependent enzyme [Pseudomonadota bacterium]
MASVSLDQSEADVAAPTTEPTRAPRSNPDATSIPPPSLARDLISDNFAIVDGTLAIGGLSVRALADTYGTPFFAYDANVMRRTYGALSAAVADFATVYYSIKANPLVSVAQVFVKEGAGLELASQHEFEIARAAGCAPEDMLFAGPGKGAHELARVIEAGIGEIHLESFEEIAHAAALAERFDRTVDVAIRVNPIASAQGGAMRMGGKPTSFGFDEEMLADVVAAVGAHPRLAISGVHLFAGTQLLAADVLVAQWAHGLRLAAQLADLTGTPLRTIDLGGGLGVPYHQGDAPLDLAAVAAAVPHLRAMRDGDARLAGARVLLEPGRYLTASAGVYVMGVRAVKQSRGERFVVCDGGMHHHLAASGNLGQVIKRDYPLLAAEKLNDTAVHQANVVGPLCTPLDTLGRKTALPDLEQGDLVAVLQSGAYGVSASPVGFLSHPRPVEILIDGGAHRAVSPLTHTLGQVAEK